jgi:hypothetical protein
MLAAIPADLRMMGAESTWVAHGVGYELVTRSKLEILPLMSQLDDQSRFFTKVFGVDPAKVIAAVRRVGPPGTMPEASAPVPFDAGPVVEIVVARPLQKGERVDKADAQGGGSSGQGGQGRGGYTRGGSGGGGANGGGGAADVNTDEPSRFGASGPTARVVRAWLSARASTLTGQPATSSAASAMADDPRVPAWAEDALPGLAVPTSREDTTTARLAMQIDSLYPIHTFLSMSRPGALAAMGRGGAPGSGGRGTVPGATGGGGSGASGGGMGGGGMGGMGGGRRGGGMGGMGGGGGRGGSSRGGGSGGADGGRPNAPFTGGALFAAQALVFGRYLAVREGPAFIGTLVDAQIQSKDVAAVFGKALMVPSDLERLDIEFHRWLIDRATHGR